MQEVVIQIRFTKECLGFAKKPVKNGSGVIYCMPRDGKGRVIFLPSWWRNNLVYAAKVTGMHYAKVPAIDWAGAVEGNLSEWKRFVTPPGQQKRRYALHEAFRANTVVEVSAVLPDGLPIEDFSELLDVAGTYKGISPFQGKDDVYGTFETVSVKPAIRNRSIGREVTS